MPASLEQGDLASRFCARGSGSTLSEISICSIASFALMLCAAPAYSSVTVTSPINRITGCFAVHIEGDGVSLFRAVDRVDGIFDR